MWESKRCPAELRKKIVRTLIHEIVVDVEDAAGMIGLVIHWQGGTHTRIEMEKPRRQRTNLDRRYTSLLPHPRQLHAHRGRAHARGEEVHARRHGCTARVTAVPDQR